MVPHEQTYTPELQGDAAPFEAHRGRCREQAVGSAGDRGRAEWRVAWRTSARWGLLGGWLLATGKAERRLGPLNVSAWEGQKEASPARIPARTLTRLQGSPHQPCWVLCGPRHSSALLSVASQGERPWSMDGVGWGCQRGCSRASEPSSHTMHMAWNHSAHGRAGKHHPPPAKALCPTGLQNHHTWSPKSCLYPAVKGLDGWVPRSGDWPRTRESHVTAGWNTCTGSWIRGEIGDRGGEVYAACFPTTFRDSFAMHCTHSSHRPTIC